MSPARHTCKGPSASDLREVPARPPIAVTVGLSLVSGTDANATGGFHWFSRLALQAAPMGASARARARARDRCHERTLSKHASSRATPLEAS